MLKRRREPSPQPALSSADAYADLFSSPVYASSSPQTEDADERAIAPCPRAKRRRTAAPVLDGSQRGWASHSDAHDDDDGEEDWLDDDEPTAHADHAAATSAADYHSVNTLLHQVHQHRRITPASPSPPVTIKHAPQSHQFSPHLPHARHAPKGVSPAVADFHARRLEHDAAAFKLAPTGRSPAPDRDPTREMECVRNRYEDMNKSAARVASAVVLTALSDCCASSLSVGGEEQVGHTTSRCRTHSSPSIHPRILACTPSFSPHALPHLVSRSHIITLWHGSVRSNVMIL